MFVESGTTAVLKMLRLFLIMAVCESILHEIQQPDGEVLYIWIPDKNITQSPTMKPTIKPTVIPTQSPSTLKSSESPTKSPTLLAIANPDEVISSQISGRNALKPKRKKTKKPTQHPITLSPTMLPTTVSPTKYPTYRPTKMPKKSTKKPTRVPTTRKPTNYPTTKPTKQPTKQILNHTISSEKTKIIPSVHKQLIHIYSINFKECVIKDLRKFESNLVKEQSNVNNALIVTKLTPDLVKFDALYQKTKSLRSIIGCTDNVDVAFHISQLFFFLAQQRFPLSDTSRWIKESLDSMTALPEKVFYDIYQKLKLLYNKKATKTQLRFIDLIRIIYQISGIKNTNLMHLKLGKVDNELNKLLKTELVVLFDLYLLMSKKLFLMKIEQFYLHYKQSYEANNDNNSWLFANTTLAIFRADHTAFEQRIDRVIANLKSFHGRDQPSNLLPPSGFNKIQQDIQNISNVVHRVWGFMHAFCISDALIKWQSISELQNRSIHMIFTKDTIESLIDITLIELGFHKEPGKVRRYDVRCNKGQIGTFRTDKADPVQYMDDVLKSTMFRGGVMSVILHVLDTIGMFIVINGIFLMLYLLLWKYTFR